MNRCLRFIYKDLPYKSIPRVLTRHDGKNCTPGLSTSWLVGIYRTKRNHWHLAHGGSWHAVVATVSSQACQGSQVSGASVQMKLFYILRSLQFVSPFVKPPSENLLLVHLEANSSTSPILLVLVLEHLLPLNLIRLLWYNVGIHLCFWKCPREPCWLLSDFPVKVRRGVKKTHTNQNYTSCLPFGSYNKPQEKHTSKR